MFNPEGWERGTQGAVKMRNIVSCWKALSFRKREKCILALQGGALFAFAPFPS